MAGVDSVDSYQFKRSHLQTPRLLLLMQVVVMGCHVSTGQSTPMVTLILERIQHIHVGSTPSSYFPRF